MVEKTGWEANKKASPIYKRDIEDGSMITDENCNPILDCDFSDVIKRISHSQATCFFSCTYHTNSIKVTGRSEAARMLTFPSFFQKN